MTIATKKKRLHEKIDRINSKAELEALENFFRSMNERQKVMKYVTTVKEDIDFEALKREQNYRPEKIKEIYGCIADGEETIEELLATLSK